MATGYSIEITHHLSFESQGRYELLPFDLPDQLEKFEVSYAYPPGSSSAKAVVDLGILDLSGKFIGWSGSSRSHITVGEFTSTPGYYMTKLQAGTWKIIIGAYKIPPEGLNVTYQITFFPRKARWFVGDLHMHSTASDGQHDLAVLCNRAKKGKLDFIGVANHNNSAENIQLPKVPDLTLIPAVEWTHYKGHLNIFGLAEPFQKQFLVNSEEEMLALLQDARDRGGLLSVNHPCDESCAWLWPGNAMFDMVEVWNSVMRRSNLQAIDFWHKLLLQGRKMPLVGGSDFHRDRHFAKMGHPVTWIYADSPSSEDLLKALRLGHSYVSHQAQGIQLDLSCGQAIMGDTLSFSSGLSLHYTVKNVGILDKILLVSSEETLQLSACSGQIPIQKNWRFAYLKVIRKAMHQDYVRAISNPLYFLHD